ncbi:MAG: right-handed parallel beta-helix repeat-containing protein [Deltaproteobacteria bacterium]|nr:right-handed parallel beta-helix repeat-containing protein [Deltaproteobacteria bacterium]
MLVKAIELRSAGKTGQPPCEVANHGCAELKALPALYARFGMILASGDGVTLSHIVLNGNRQGRGGTPAYAKCSTLEDNSLGMNGAFMCSNCTLSHSVAKNALCGTGFLVAGAISNVSIINNTFAENGVHTVANLWADGLTVHDAPNSTFTGNTFIDNTDIDLIFGGCTSCKIQSNKIVHSANASGGAFAALMIQKWPTTSGCYADVDVSHNSIDCGPNRLCGSGIYIGSESWYPETPYGTLTPGTTSGSIHHNSIVNAMNGLYIAAQGLTIYQNGVLNAHGVSIPNSCHTPLVSATPYVVSPTSKDIHFMGENVDPVMKVHFSSASWAGCIPNFPF